MPDESERRAYTDPAEWPAETDGGRDMELPSGAFVRVAQPPIVYLGMSGKIPARFTAMAKHHEAAGDAATDWEPAEVQEIVDWLICEAFVRPKCSTSPQPGELDYAQLSDRDKNAVLMACNLVMLAEALKRS
jgi:hypothetical protein